MKRIDKIIKILKDGERDFRLKPDYTKHNQSGICWYIYHHPLLISLTKRTKIWYIKTILKDMNCNDYCFTEGSGQGTAWTLKIPRYNTERSNWCRLTLEEIQKEGK